MSAQQRVLPVVAARIPVLAALLSLNSPCAAAVYARSAIGHGHCRLQLTRAGVVGMRNV